ncbi:MAG: hypothetical protein A6F71_10425 [Cycloclasticus sp. symbiont of Poecilosclerida sp. M]|nr:MAG: hypothetical protein A6F71_10425 [Cycloclasticus sp. symbiont of Poecilosclerida sp. M]
MHAKLHQYLIEVIRKRAECVFGEFFGMLSNIDNVDYEALTMELSSNRGKHPKWWSLMMDETFQLEATESTSGNMAMREESRI